MTVTFSHRSKSQLLICDDDPDVIGLLDAQFSAETYDLLIANDGATALELARVEQPDIILLDVSMSGMDGFQVCERLKADAATAELPIIFMTAHDEPRHRLRGFEVGAVDYVSKPFSTPELVARIQTHLSIRRLTVTLKERNKELEEQLSRRAAAEAARAQLMETLHQANERLAREFAERERGEALRIALQEQIIAAQRERLLEQSTPLIPITADIVAIPLIGVMNLERAQLVMETATHGVAERGYRWVILDITGVRGFDAHAAEMLIRTGRGVRLMGARTLITGVSPEAAKNLVELGTILGELIMLATLQDGIAYAMTANRRHQAAAC